MFGCVFPARWRTEDGQDNEKTSSLPSPDRRRSDQRRETSSRSFWGLTKGLQVERVSGTELLLVQQAEEAARHVHHVLDVEEQAVQVGRRRLQGGQTDTFISRRSAGLGGAELL